jgi:hypothetical protein
MGLKWIRATILMPATSIDFGIVKTAEELDLRNLDLEVVDK